LPLFSSMAQSDDCSRYPLGLQPCECHRPSLRAGCAGA
jgi:hypothetical protein